MSRIITFINEKGGTCKSSLTFHTAWELSRNSKVLVIDFDGQRANITNFFGVKKSDDMLTIFDVLKGTHTINECVTHISSNLDLVGANYIVNDISPSMKISTLKKALNDVKEYYDFIFFDVNPSPNWNHALVLSTSDYIIIPLLPETPCLEATLGIAESLLEVQETTNPKLSVLGMLFVRNSSRSNLSKEVLEIAQEISVKLNTKVYDTKIPNSVMFDESLSQHKGITLYKSSHKSSQIMQSFVKEMLQDIIKSESEV